MIEFPFGGEPPELDLVVTTARHPAPENLNKAAESTDWPAIANLEGNYPMTVRRVEVSDDGRVPIQPIH